MVDNPVDDLAALPVALACDPLLIAHRGLSARYPENTFAAFKAAADEGSRAVEFDVQMTRDGVLVVFHDDDLRRITGLSGRVSDMRWAELSALDVGVWKSASFFGERIPRLDELEPYWHAMALINIEVKVGGPDDFATIEAVADFVRHRERPFLVSSFDCEVLRRFRRLDGRTPVGVLFNGDDWGNALACAAELGASAINPDVAAALDAARVGQARRQGYEVHVHTVNDAALAHRLASSGVTGIFTDDVTALRTAMQSPVLSVLGGEAVPETPLAPPGRILPQA